MFNKSILMAATAALTIGFGATGAMADECSGRDHSTGTVLGAVGGGLIGGFASHGNGLGIIGGALLGGLAGNAISRDMDCDDQPYAARTYHDSFYGPVGERYSWERGPNHGYVVTHREYARGDEVCRDFTQMVYRGDREFDRDGTACRRPGEDWEFAG